MKFFVISTNTETGFYSRAKVKGASAKWPVETQNECACGGCAFNEETRLASKESERF